MISFKEFWLDYSIARYNKLKKYDSDPEIDIFMHVSFIQSINLNTILCLFCKIVNLELVYYLYAMIAGSIIVLVFNFLWYKKLNARDKKQIKKRIPKYTLRIYKLYALFSTVLFGLILYLLRQN
ncbi:hypothetical protein NYQ10_19330 [Flavobacterium johnsoniae]|uniref:hypothetical protein n=1 Tax=Flavobacterium johnsoniae TaxID=986 RepID=UPI0025B18C5F|nr:hypothetical protein [Flavobacterium johnsoniae]WJS94244.1 hypothetical protein NYQ10_19330 [Flavobacterium johnsoniae]